MTRYLQCNLVCLIKGIATFFSYQIKYLRVSFIGTSLFDLIMPFYYFGLLG